MKTAKTVTTAATTAMTATTVSPRLLPVPDGLAGERVDVALSRMTGLSRSKVGDMCSLGAVRLDGVPIGKSDRVTAGAMIEADLPAPQPAEPVPTPVEGMKLLYEDEDIVVVDKPAGVAAHPTMGWEGPDVLGALKAMRVPVATSGAAERQGIVSRLDVGTSGVMIVAKGERAYSARSRGRQGLPRAGPGASRSLIGYDRRPHWSAPGARVEDGDHRRRARVDHPL